MSRRQFLTRLARASSAAMLMSSPLGCGTVRGGIERLRLGDEAPILNSVQQEVVAKIIDGFNPPDTEIRQRLEKEDPDYDPVAAYAEFAWANGDEFLANMKFLIDFLNVLPTFTRTFSDRHGLPARLQLQRFHPDDANRYFLFLRDSNIRALRNIFTGAKFIGTAPIYTNEKVAWKVMRYPGPWLLDPGEARRGSRARHLVRHGPGDRRERRRPAAPRRGPRRPARPASRPRASWAGPTVSCWRPTWSWWAPGRADRSWPRSSRPRREQRVLILEKGDFVEPDRVPPARAAHDAAHLRHGVLGDRDLRPGDPHRLHRRA